MSDGYHQVLNSLTDESSILLHPTSIRWAWLTILRHARRGKIKRLNAGWLKIKAVISMEEAVMAMQVFLSPDPFSGTPDDDGVRLRPDPNEPGSYILVTWEKQREKIKLANAAMRQQRKREREAEDTETRDAVTKDHGHVTDSGDSGDKEEKVKTSSGSRRKTYPPEFESFWGAYPDRVGHPKGDKAKAFAAFRRHVNAGEQEAIIAAAKAYGETSDVARGYRKDAERWIPNWREPIAIRNGGAGSITNWSAYDE